MARPHAQIMTNPAAGNHDYGWRRAFGDGLERHGWQVSHVSEYSKCDLLVMWGVRRQDVINRVKRAQTQICILERGYVGDRFAYTSVSFGGGLNGRAEFRLPWIVGGQAETARRTLGAVGADGGERWRSFDIWPMPWREDDNGVSLIMEQVPGDQSVRGVDFSKWVRDMKQQLEMLGRKVIVRPHPGDPRKRQHGKPLAEDLAGAGQVVTYNSNSGVDAVLAGVPTVAMDEGSMAWEVSGHDPRQIIRPDRTNWLYRLAWKQFNKEEMESGMCAEAVGLHDWSS